MPIKSATLIKLEKLSQEMTQIEEQQNQQQQVERANAEPFAPSLSGAATTVDRLEL